MLRGSAPARFALRDVRSLEDRVEAMIDLVWEGLRDPEMRKLALQITRRCEARDDLCELKAIFDYNQSRIRYTGDLAGLDTFQTWRRTLEFGGGDCLPSGTLLLAKGHRLVPIEELKAGDSIWGQDAWSDVADIWFKGVLPVDAVFLNNGSSFKATADHKVYIARCPRHPVRYDDGKSCCCEIAEREIVRVTVGDLEPGMVLLQPTRIPFGTQEQDPDRAYVEGLFLSDGWADDYRFSISGQDGCPKEAQKREVQTICARLGSETTWHRKYITIRDTDWTRRVQQMGHKAWNKHALSIDLGEGAAAALLRGIMADSSARDRVLTTTSRALFLQARLLHRMFGIACGESYIVDHGGLGEHPIWRLTPRAADRSSKKFCRVRAVERAALNLPTWDLTTSDHRVYLPEADVTISQCDDHAIASATAVGHNGFGCVFRLTTSKAGTPFEHVYAVTTFPKLEPQAGIAMDTTLPGGKLGDEPRAIAAYRDFPVLSADGAGSRVRGARGW